ncbi:MAG TPA: hypothetical protein VI322_02895 [Candidatus Saccharimonadia bacterium]
MDERLEEAIESEIHQINGGAFHAALAGGGAAFTFAGDRATALKQVVAAYKINQITDVYLESHLECGAYGLAGVTFTDRTAEIARLHDDLEAAKTTILAALAEAGAPTGAVTVHTAVVDFKGNHLDRPVLTAA